MIVSDDYKAAHKINHKIAACQWLSKNWLIIIMGVHLKLLLSFYKHHKMPGQF